MHASGSSRSHRLAVRVCCLQTPRPAAKRQRPASCRPPRRVTHPGRRAPSRRPTASPAEGSRPGPSTGGSRGARGLGSPLGPPGPPLSASSKQPRTSPTAQAPVPFLGSAPGPLKSLHFPAPTLDPGVPHNKAPAVRRPHSRVTPGTPKSPEVPFKSHPRVSRVPARVSAGRPTAPDHHPRLLPDPAPAPRPPAGSQRRRASPWFTSRRACVKEGSRESFSAISSGRYFSSMLGGRPGPGTRPRGARAAAAAPQPPPPPAARTPGPDAAAAAKPGGRPGGGGATGAGTGRSAPVPGGRRVPGAGGRGGRDAAPALRAGAGVARRPLRLALAARSQT